MSHTFERLTSQRISRRQFLRIAGGVGLSAAGISLLGSCSNTPSATNVSDERLETTTIRLAQSPPICTASAYLAEEFLRQDGFTDVKYIKRPTNSPYVEPRDSSDAVDMSLAFVASIINWVDQKLPLITLAGVHIGCFELFGGPNIRTLSDLKGKTLYTAEENGADRVFLSSFVSYIGLDPDKDINWVTLPYLESKELFAAGKIDAFLAFPPVAQELRAKKIGRLIISSITDKPWSQYFCCMVTVHTNFMQKNPVATKRALRAILKAADICASQPERAAKFMVDKDYAVDYEYTLQAMRDIPHNRWRDYEPEDSLRFYALRQYEAGKIKLRPDEIIAQGADWRFLNEIKSQLANGNASETFRLPEELTYFCDLNI
jgi:NitT/TauT family transport system substrate-binding protein